MKVPMKKTAELDFPYPPPTCAQLDRGRGCPFLRHIAGSLPAAFSRGDRASLPPVLSQGAHGLRCSHATQDKAAFEGNCRTQRHPAYLLLQPPMPATRACWVWASSEPKDGMTAGQVRRLYPFAPPQMLPLRSAKPWSGVQRALPWELATTASMKAIPRMLSSMPG